MLSLPVDKAVCAVLDRRLHHFPTIFDDFKAKMGVELEAFVSGDGRLPNLRYDRVDDGCLPESRIAWPKWHLRPNAFDATKSHRAIIQQAVDEGVGKLLFVEDDCGLIDRTPYHLGSQYSFLVAADYDLFYFGGHHYDGRKMKRSKHYASVAIADRIAGTHCIILSSKVMKWILTQPCVAPIDHQLMWDGRDLFKSYCSAPPLAYQFNGYSHTIGEKYDHNQALYKVQ